MSRYEIELWSSMSALTAVLRDEIHPSDIMQVHVSSRATASVQLTAAICRLVGAGCRVLGVIPADEALDSLVGGATLMSASPSYLGELVVAARRRGLTRSDFRLTRIDSGGEILSTSLKAAAAEIFGARVNDAFGMTEVIPVSATTCSQGHLHHDLNMGLVELVDLATGEPAEPGALCTVVVTPYYPYRECMPVFRYDTRDVVRKLDDKPLTCEIAGLPGTGPIVGKADQILRLGADRVVTPRDLLEAVESLPSQPWPARYRAQVSDGRLALTLPISAVAGLGADATQRHFADRGLEVNLRLVDDDHARSLRPVRSDLHETTFVSQATYVGGSHAAR
jgi:phenylacetate-coenzyme A ligase PaaK-like adenylate-forming protein